MKILVVSGRGGTLGDDMVYCVIEDWLRELEVETVHSLPCSEDTFKLIDGMIIGGCGIIYDEGVVIDVKGNSERYYNFVREAKKNGIPIIGLGLGWQGLKLTIGKEIWKDTLNSLQFLTVWNEQTAIYLKSIGVETEIVTTCDLGFALKPMGNPFITDYALLTHNPDLIAKDCHQLEWKNRIIYNLSEISRSISGTFTIYPFVNHGLDELFKIGKLIIQGEPHHILGAIGGANVCITTTLHAIIAGAVMNRRILAFYPPEPLKPKIKWMVNELKIRALPINSEIKDIIRELNNTQSDKPPNISKYSELNLKNKFLLTKWIRNL